jgi:hypothetical protein
MLRMVPSENVKHEICRFIRPGILLLLLVLPVNAGIRLEGRDKELASQRIIQTEQRDNTEKRRMKQPEKETGKETVTNHQFSYWNRIQFF